MGLAVTSPHLYWLITNRFEPYRNGGEIGSCGCSRRWLMASGTLCWSHLRERISRVSFNSRRHGRNLDPGAGPINGRSRKDRPARTSRRWPGRDYSNRDAGDSGSLLHAGCRKSQSPIFPRAAVCRSAMGICSAGWATCVESDPKLPSLISCIGDHWKHSARNSRWKIFGSAINGTMEENVFPCPAIAKGPEPATGFA